MSGRVTMFDNNSGHFLPLEAEAMNYGKILRGIGLDVRGAKLPIWAANPSTRLGARIVGEITLD